MVPNDPVAVGQILLLLQGEETVTIKNHNTGALLLKFKGDRTNVTELLRSMSIVSMTYDDFDGLIMEV